MTRDQKTAAVDALEKSLDEVTAVYLADYSGLSVEESNDLRRQFRAAGVSFHLTEVKGPVMDRLERGGFPERLGRDHFHLSTHRAFRALATGSSRLG